MAVATTKTFSAAAKKLHLTQSALSQRVLNLEDKLQLTLFIRDKSGIRLTEAGQRLLKYGQMIMKLEAEVLADLLVDDEVGDTKTKKDYKDDLVGRVKLAGFSTFVRSLLIPKVGQFIKKNPRVQIDIMIRELHELKEILKSGQADFIFCNSSMRMPDIEHHLLGHEENVLIEPLNKRGRQDIYIDHDEVDSTTDDFWRIQKSSIPEYKRIYFDEIYSIIDAV